MSEVPGSSQPRAQAVSSVLYRLLVHKSQLWQYSSMLHVGRFHVPQESHTTHTWRWGQCEEVVFIGSHFTGYNLSLFSIKIYFILIKQLSFCLCNLQMPIFIAIPAVRNSASLSWSMIFQLIKLLCSLIAKLAHSPPQLKRLWVVTEILNLTFSIILTSWSRALYFELLIMIHPLVPIYIQLVIQI